MTAEPRLASQRWALARPRVLETGWHHASAPPGSGPAPAGLTWQPASPLPRGSDALDHWFRRDGAIAAPATLEFTGLATQTEIWLDGALAATHATMFRPLLVPVPPGGAVRIEICARALRPPPASPRARWRNRLVPGEALRSVRTSLEGRIPGTGEPVVGPYRPVLLHPGPVPLRPELRAWLEDGNGVVTVHLPGMTPGHDAGALRVAGVSAPFQADAAGLTATLRLRRPALWWPHTHGDPVLHAAEAVWDGAAIPLGTAGFRTVAPADGPGLSLLVNGVPVFCRGALWSGRGSLRHARAAGLNMVRVPGTAAYPPPCAAAAAGLMIWQDFMFARFDYPLTPDFLAEVRAEARHVLTLSGADPAVAVLCGGDEIGQAAAMAGRPTAEWRHLLFHEVLAAEAAALRPDAIYVPEAPHGAVPPFAASAPVAHFFGVGAYQRPLHEAAGVQFAAACLAFSNPPDAQGCRALCTTPGDAAWAAALPRDPGTSWTFEEPRDHYAATLLGADMAALRRTDPERWLAMGRAAVALAMQSALTTWRADPGCGGALILGLQDAVPGAGWGLIDHAGRPKSALHAVAQTMQPIQVLLRDEGMDGVAAHLFNETGAPCTAALRLRGLTPAGVVDPLGEIEITLPPRGTARYPAAAIMGRFADLAGIWRFGPPAFTVLGAVLVQSGVVLSAATLFVGPPLPATTLGLTAVPEGAGVRVGTAAFAQFVTIDAGPHAPDRDHFHLWPGESVVAALRGAAPAAGSVTALNGLDTAHFRMKP